MKNICFTFCLLLLVVFIVTPTDMLQLVGLSVSSHTQNRVLYVFFHANIIHLAMNIYALLTIYFLSCPMVMDSIASALIAILIPTCFLGHIPIVGISVFIFAITGILVARSNRWMSFFLFNLLVIVSGAMIARIAFAVHLYGFAFGLLYGFITAKRYGSI